MSFSDRTMTEPYTSREVSTVPGEGDANLLLQDSKAAAPYSTIERKPENLRIFWLSLFTGKVVEINSILPLSACGRRAAEKMHLTGTARSVKKQFRNDRSRFGTANYKNNISAVYGAAHAEPF